MFRITDSFEKAVELCPVGEITAHCKGEIMARKELADDGFLTLNETAVGKNGNNRRKSDIQLVQFFLHQFFLKNPELFRKLPPTKRKQSVIIIDGQFGKQTEAGIKVFQEELVRLGVPVKTDGLVSVMTGRRSSRGNPFTINFLNSFFKTFGEGNEFSNNLENHPLIFSSAPELAAELFISQARDDFKG
jgi:hypothetical protein